MNPIEQIQQAFQHYLITTFNLSASEAQQHVITLNTDESKQQFGDLSLTSALVLAKKLTKNPRDIAQQISCEFSHEYSDRIEVAGPGFLNIFLSQQAYRRIAEDLATMGDAFFRSSSMPTKTFNIEFVSANPTGPLHLGHGRGGIIGDVLGMMLRFLGHTVIKEFYINDAGVQIQKLGLSFKLRCQQILGHQVILPEDAYHGEYLLELAHTAFKAHGSDLLHKNELFFQEYAKEHLLTDIKKTLQEYGIIFDTWFSEKTLHVGGSIEAALKLLDQRKQLYVHDQATWFKSTQYGDDKDRVVRKASGELTYVAADIAYLQNKVERGADHLIMILGHDHHSYEIRLQSVRQALHVTPPLDIILYQLVSMKAGGQQVRMSKRAGNIVTLKDVIETVGTDVARFFYLHRKADAHLEFDLDLALKTTEENPVYYIQYAYVRINSILQKAQQEPAFAHIALTEVRDTGVEEHTLIKKIAALKELLLTMSTNYQTHLLAYYTIELANSFHRYYNQVRVLDSEHVATSRARLAMLHLLHNHFARCFDLLGISKPQKM
jgi:arginyl-tRNA synthetase